MPIRINTVPRCTASAPVALAIHTENTMARAIAAIANVPPGGLPRVRRASEWQSSGLRTVVAMKLHGPRLRCDR
jgi:hypothetical protein